MTETPTRARTITGRIWLFGDDMNTDVIHPPAFFSLDPEKVKRGLFHGYDPTIQPNIQPDDIIVGGSNFGCGSSRETSIRAIKLNKIGAVVAVDFARIFFRNATNNGLPCLPLADPADLAKLTAGQRITVDPYAATLTTESGETLALEPPGEFVSQIWAAGGLLQMLPGSAPERQDPGMREFTFPGRDGQPITAYRWDPAATPRGVVQLTHGMGEHVRRYDALAGTLTGEGFVVVGQDHRGHGATATTLGELGPGGWAALVDDIGVLAGLTRDEYPDLPHVLVAHSMGSFAAQQFLLDHSRDVTAVALTGTSLLDLLEPALDLDAPLELSAFNAPFLPARTDYDWLSRDEEQVDRYVADPHCGFGIDTTSGKTMFVGARALADPARLAAMRPDLPIYVAVGELDPVGGQTALVTALVERYRAAGLTDVTLTVYPGARHEVFNETNRDEVVADLLTWLSRVST